MSSFQCISAADAKQKLTASEFDVIVDVRSEQAFQAAHIPGAEFLDKTQIQQFVDGRNHDQNILVYCNHGNSSKVVSRLLASEGFANVYSLDGGFEGFN